MVENSFKVGVGIENLFGNASRSATPLFSSPDFVEIKDPCPVFDGLMWHLFCTAVDRKSRQFVVLHLKSESLTRQWSSSVCKIQGITGSGICAPGVIYSDSKFHMYIQNEYCRPGGHIVHLASSDGNTFVAVDTILQAVLDTDHAVVYDAHPAEIRGHKYITYSASREVGKPDIYLLKSESETWNGPWEKCGTILTHEDVPHHNSRSHKNYEWGLEGSQLIQFSEGICLSGVCFLSEGVTGSRQRIFWAFASHISGPFKTAGGIFGPTGDGWQSGEVGHGAGIVVNNSLHFFYQARRAGAHSPWSIGIISVLLGGKEPSLSLPVQFVSLSGEKNSQRI
ncbi:hypothetical protein KW783_00830 [Candidatus Parcubacteria bacterium]|nr:hypothetical protein [Candidatus Parcubacteria bacterium]